MMLRRLALSAALALWPVLASAQMAIIAPTAPVPDSSDRIANTSWVNATLAAGIPLASGKIFIGSAGNLATGQTMSGDATLSILGALTLATVNANVGAFGSATQCPTLTINGKGLITAASATTCTPAVGSITGLGTGVATALGNNVGSAGAVVTNGGVLGTPSSGTATNLTGTAPGLTAGNVTTNANLTGPITSTGNATAIASQTGTGTKFVVDNSPTLTGTPLAPTAAVDTNTTQIATQAAILQQAASAAPLANAQTAAVGTSTRYARADHVHPGRVLLTGNLTLYYRTDGNNACNGTVNAAGSSGNCAFADPQAGINAALNLYDRGGFTITIQAGETVAKTFSPPAAGYSCATGFTGGGTTVVSGNLNQATVTTPIASPGVVNWTAHGFTAGQPVYFSGGTLPTGLNATQLFYVIAAGLTTNAFEVSTTPGGAAVNFTGSSSGTQTGNALTTLIDGTTNTGSGFTFGGGGCAMQLKNFQIKASVNSTACIAGSSGPAAFSWANFIWLGTTFGDDVFLGPNCSATQLGTDWIAAQLGATAHIQAGHGAEMRNSGQITNISANLTYGTTLNSFVYASFDGRVVYTASPVINLNGFTVTGQRCYADSNGIVEQSSLGATFFPGNSICGTATQGQIFQ